MLEPLQSSHSNISYTMSKISFRLRHKLGRQPSERKVIKFYKSCLFNEIPDVGIFIPISISNVEYSNI
jgi:hypothetical protein